MTLWQLTLKIQLPIRSSVNNSIKSINCGNSIKNRTNKVLGKLRNFLNRETHNGHQPQRVPPVKARNRENSADYINIVVRFYICLGEL